MSKPPTAIFVTTDEAAIAVLEAARELDLEVPQNLSVIGFNETEMAHFARLTTAGRHLLEMGAKGARQLLEAIDRPDRPPSQVQLPTKLVVRQTTAPPCN